MTGSSHIYYNFKWLSRGPSGEINGRYEQSIEAPTLAEAAAIFVDLHGELLRDEYGTVLEITHVGVEDA